MSKWIIIAGTAFVWSAGFAATAALSYVTREPAPVIAKLPTPPPAPLPVAKTMPLVHQNPVVVLPTLEIVGSPPMKHVAVARPATTHEIRCSEFRPLEQGSSSVQICE